MILHHILYFNIDIKTFFEFQISQEKYLKAGSFVRIIRPVADKNRNVIIAKDDSYIALGATIAGMEGGTDPTNEEKTFLSNFATLGPNEDIRGKLTLKIVKKLGPKIVRSQYGETTVLKLTVKDKQNDKIMVALWQSHPMFKKIEEGKVYFIDGLTTDKLPEKPPHNLKAKRTTQIQLAPAEIQEKFQDITHVDGNISGMVVAFLNVICYGSCKECWCSLKGQQIGSNCPQINCQKEIKECVPDFRFQMLVETGNDTMEFTGFKRVLNLHDEPPEFDNLRVEEFLSTQFLAQQVQVSFVKRLEYTGEKQNIIDALVF